MPKARAPLEPRIKVLFLAANPVPMDPLRLPHEVRQIQEKIGASKHGDSIEFIVQWAARPDDLQQLLLKIEPHILHFSGHGSDKEGLYFESPEGIRAPVEKETLAHLLGVLKGNIRLVVFNACQTRALAEAIAGNIDCAIATDADISDDAAIEFSAAFYRAIGFGKSVKVAFDLGQNALLSKQIASDRTPELYVRSGIDPDGIIFVLPSPARTDRPPWDQVIGNSLMARLAVVAVAVTIVLSLAALFVLKRRETIEQPTPEPMTCAKGERQYKDRCLPVKIVNFIVCLKEANIAAAVRSIEEDALKSPTQATSKGAR